MKKILAPLIGAALLSSAVYAMEEVDPVLAEISNFRQYSDTFASAGQPTR